ncbi:MAG TPA: biopolymer transporter ExbD [Steroidobacteraceae bacterium]|nr:biopolymer transporter ExbD [Steroidobacteraceae bacterium]
MAISTQEEDGIVSEINITPLVDVMLVLLVAFVITIPVLTNAVHVNLPKTVTTTPPEQQKAITVTVDEASRIYLDNTEIAGEALGARLAGLKTANADVSLHLRADDRVPYGPVAKVMAAIEQAGISRVSVLTESE